MTYSLGKKSNENLVGVHPIMISICKLAISLSEQDFQVFEGCRTLARQQKLKASGASRTLDSMHIPQQDRSRQTANIYGHAVDLVPWIDGSLRWEWGPCFKIAVAIDAAATQLGHADKICWGGVWDKFMDMYGGSPERMKAEVAAYGVRHPGPDFVDGPHFQLFRLR